MVLRGGRRVKKQEGGLKNKKIEELDTSIEERKKKSPREQDAFGDFSEVSRRREDSLPFVC